MDKMIYDQKRVYEGDSDKMNANVELTSPRCRLPRVFVVVHRCIWRFYSLCLYATVSTSGTHDCWLLFDR